MNSNYFFLPVFEPGCTSALANFQNAEAVFAAWDQVIRLRDRSIVAVATGSRRSRGGDGWRGGCNAPGPRAEAPLGLQPFSQPGWKMLYNAPVA